MASCLSVSDSFVANMCACCCVCCCVSAWPTPHCTPFRDLLVHPATLPVLTELLGSGFRLDHSPLVIGMQKGSNGHTLHGGAIEPSTGQPDWSIAYECRHEAMRAQLLTMSVALSEVRAGDGGFCVVPGSHKSNFEPPGEPSKQ